MRSLACTLLVLFLVMFARAAFAEPVRIVIAAGSKQGLPAERPLRYADSDARRVRDLMLSHGGTRTEHAFYLAEPSRTELFATIDRARAEADRHRPDEVVLLFYYSGHGDRQALHLGSDRLLVADLSTKLAQVRAGLRIVVTDACRSTRDKGFAVDEPFAMSAKLIPQATGQVWLHASSDGEAAQESDELQGAIFTQAWLSGLRGAADANGDAHVTLEESFAFAHSQTLLRSAKSSGVIQKPEAVIDLREAAPVVITQTTAQMGTLALPAARDTHFLVYSEGAKSVLSEVWSSPSRSLRLRVPPGRYLVHQRVAGRGTLAQVAVGQGEERKLEDRDFRPAALEPLAIKGSEGADTPGGEPAPPNANTRHELSAGYDAGLSARTGMVHGPRVTYAYALRSFALTAGAAADVTGRSLADKDERLTTVYGRAGAELRWSRGALAFRAGAGARAGIALQSITPKATPGAGARAPETSQSAFALGPEITAGARLGLSAIWFVDLAATGVLLFLREEETPRGIPGATGALSLGARF